MVDVALLERLLDSADGLVLVWVGVFVRVGAACFLLPGVGNAGTSVRIRLAAAVALTAVVAPATVPSVDPVPPFVPEVIGPAFAAEAVAGLIIGLSARLLIFALQIAGTVAAQSLSVAQMFGGMGGEPQPAASSLLVMAGVALAMTAGLHVKVAIALIGSYGVIPFSVFAGGGDVALWTAERGQAMIEMAVGLALPFAIVGFIYNLALGAINRAMPQLMVAFVGAPFITGAGLVVLMLASPALLAYWLGALDAVLADPFGLRP